MGPGSAAGRRALVYLDQNHASRIAKHVLGRPGHEHFGRLHAALRSAGALVPPSPFHVAETRGGYLLPTLKRVFAELSRGWWVRPWREVLAAQAARRAVDRHDLLTRRAHWETTADLTPLEDLPGVPLRGDLVARARQARRAIVARLHLGVPPQRSAAVPFLWLLSRLLAFQSLDAERRRRPSDLLDLVMAATVAPYADVLATDRYVRESLERIGFAGRVASGRRHEVERLAGELARGGGPASRATHGRRPRVPVNP